MIIENYADITFLLMDTPLFIKGVTLLVLPL